MNSEIGQLRGIEIEYCEGTLEFDVASIEIKAEADTEYRGSFRMIAHAPMQAVGNIYTTDYRMTCSDKGFRGKDMEVPFLYDTTGMECGDVVRGEFYIISNMGEYYLPYEVKITGAVLDSELGEIKNLFHFANLAKVNWNEALKCFASENFPHILTGSGKQYAEAYHGLVENGRENDCMDYAMEQFLILIRKKQPVSFRWMEEEIKYAADEIPEQLSLMIERNGWGYTELSIEAEGNFINEMKTVLHETDFNNDCAKVLVQIYKRKLHIGWNCATVSFESGECTGKCRLVVEKVVDNEGERIYRFRKKQMTSIMMRLYLDYRTGRKQMKECLALAGEILEQVRGMNELMPALYQAHLKLLVGQMNEAGWLLKHAKRMMEGVEMPLEKYGYFLYLTAMSDSDDRKRAEELLNQYVVQYPECFALYWGYMHKENLQQKNPGAVYRKLKEFWENGCFSPVLFLEAAMIVLEQPVVFSVMDRFELQLLQFMDRYDLLEDRICEQIYHAAESVKGYHPMLVETLSKYPIKDKKRMTKVLCLQYMRGACKGEEAAATLRTGIEEGCRITGLYEAYIRALAFNQGEVLPTTVVRYFAFDSFLDDTHLAYVYAKVMRQREEIKEDYEEKIHTFVARQLAAGRIDENLAYLYRNVLIPEEMNEQMQKQLLEISFTHVLDVNNPAYQNCIVRHEGIRGQRKYAIKSGKALVQIYSDHYTLLFEDKNGFCHCPDQGYKLSPLLGYERIKPLLKGCEEITFGEQFYKFCRKPVEQIDNAYEFRSTEKNCRWLLEQPNLTEEFRRELAGNLLRAYGKWDFHEELDAFLEIVQADDFGGKDKSEFVFLLCDRGFYKKAFETACTYGYEKTDDRVLARLCQYMIEDKEGAYDSGVLKLAYRVFARGKYTESMIEYLVKWFGGTVKQMRKVWKAAVAMEVSATDIAERILRQILITGAYTADRERIFAYYCEQKGSSDLARTYLSMRAIEYLVRDEAVEDSVFEKLQKDLLCKEKYSLGAKLAVLKYNSSRVNELNEAGREMCAELLGESLGEDIYFPYYKAYTDFYPVLELYGEASYIELQSKPGICVTIHYIIDRSKEEAASYCKEEMTEVYPGIYQKAFRLFWGERLQYYVTQKQGEEEQFVLSGSMERGESMDENGHGRFRLLNDIALSMELRDYHTAETLAYEYAQNSFFTEKMLRLK